jgi:hypothetical protein
MPEATDNWFVALAKGVVRKKFGLVILTVYLLFLLGEAILSKDKPERIEIILAYVICFLMTLNTVAFVIAQYKSDNKKKGP